MLPGWVAIERVAGPVKRYVVGQRHRQIFGRHRHDAALLAMNDGNRAAPVALARDAPVAQPEIDLALRNRPIAGRLCLKPLGDLFLGLRDGHAVEKARIDHATVAVIGGVGHDEALWIDIGRTNDRRIAELVLVGEFQVALIMCRTAEDGAGAVVHQNKVRHIDRQLPIRIEWMARADAGIEAELFRSVDVGLRGAAMPAFVDEG